MTPLPRPDPEPARGIASNGRPRESVWEYPRPPEIRPEPRPVEVRHSEITIAESVRAVRVCETAGAPAVYLPPDDVEGDLLRPAAGRTICEFKGTASYLDLVTPAATIERAAWTYRRPTARYAELAGWISFYPALVECYLADERVKPQPGRFYGGWVTAEITGPIKGAPGTEGW